MRQRFTEINVTGNATPLPIGAEASNITLSDGSILEQALGDIDYQKKGSIIDQLNTIQKTNVGEFAPLQAPHFKEGIILRRYASNNSNFLTQVQPRKVEDSVHGITGKYNGGIWTFNGTITSATDSRLYILYGENNFENQITGPGDYAVSVINNGTLIDTKTSLQFLWHNSNTGENGEFFIQETSLNGTFSIPENCYLCIISLFIDATASNTVLTNSTLQITLTKTDGTPVEDKYNSVFDIQKNLSTNSWKTTVAENFTVDKGLQGEAKSILGTIYDSSWAGELNMKEDPTSNLIGIRVPNGGISFPAGELTNYGTAGDTLAERRSKFLQKSIGIRRDGLYIAPHYYISSNNTSSPTLFYAAPKHWFWITDREGKTDGSSALFIEKDKTTVFNTLIADQVRSNSLPSYVFIDTRKELEDIINDDVNYPNFKVILFSTAGKMGTYLTSGTVPASGGINVYGFGRKYKDSKKRSFVGVFAYGNLWRFEYSWEGNGKRHFQCYALTTGGSANPRVNKTNLNAPNSSGW